MCYLVVKVTYFFNPDTSISVYSFKWGPLGDLHRWQCTWDSLGRERGVFVCLLAGYFCLLHYSLEWKLRKGWDVWLLFTTVSPGHRKLSNTLPMWCLVLDERMWDVMKECKNYLFLAVCFEGARKRGKDTEAPGAALIWVSQSKGTKRSPFCKSKMQRGAEKSPNLWNPTWVWILTVTLNNCNFGQTPGLRFFPCVKRIIGPPSRRGRGGSDH